MKKGKPTSGLCILSIALFLSIVAGLVFLLFSSNLQLIRTSENVLTDESNAWEKFNNGALIPADKLVVFQGNTLPDLPNTAVKLDNDESLPTVDGTTDTPRSMFALAFNKCDPSCCPSTYSCSGGCVCMTDKQYDFIGTRGSNNRSGCKLRDNPEY